MSIITSKPPPFPYSVLELVGSNGIHYSSLLNNDDMISQYKDVNILAGEVQKLIILCIIESKQVYSDEDGSDFKLSLTHRGKNILKNQSYK